MQDFLMFIMSSKPQPIHYFICPICKSPMDLLWYSTNKIPLSEILGDEYKGGDSEGIMFELGCHSCKLYLKGALGTNSNRQTFFAITNIEKYNSDIFSS